MAGIHRESDLEFGIAKYLGHISRQRIRFVQMELRKYSTDARMRNERQFWTVLENNGIRFPQRTAIQFMSLVKDQRGINIETASKYLKQSQKRTRRDSVEALKQGEISAEKKQNRRKKNAKRETEIQTALFRKRMSLDEFRRVGRLVVNVKTLTGMAKDPISLDEEDFDGPESMEGEEFYDTKDSEENGNILRMLLDKRTESADHEANFEETNHPEADPDRLPPQMEYLKVPSPKKDTLLTNFDPPDDFNPNETNIIEVPKIKGKKSKKSPCTITITVEDTEVNGKQHPEEVNENDQQDLRQPSCYEQASECRKKANDIGEVIIEIPEEETLYQENQFQDKVGKLEERDETNKDDGDIPDEMPLPEEQEFEIVKVDNAALPREEEGNCKSATPEKQTQEETNDANLENDYVEPTHPHGHFDNEDPTQTPFNEETENDEEKHEGSSGLPEDDNIRISESGDEKHSPEEVFLVKNDDQDSLKTPQETKDNLDVHTANTDSEASAENADVTGENDNVAFLSEEQLSTAEQSVVDKCDENLADYSTDSLVSDETSDGNETDVQSSSADEDDRHETDCDTRSIADYGGENIQIGRHEITLFPPEWYRDKEYTDIICNKATSFQPRQEVEWVYGCEISHAQSLATIGDDEIIYGSGCIVVLYNYPRHSQRHYFGHSGPISCVAVHPDQAIVGSAQSESIVASEMVNTASEDLRASSDLEPNHGRIHIRVWNVIDLTTMYTIGVGTFQKPIKKMQFMKFRNYILTIEEDIEASLTLWDAGCKLKKVPTVVNFPEMIERAQQKTSYNTKGKVEKKPETFSRAISATAMHGAEFAIAGKQHLGFWKIKDIDYYTSDSGNEEFVKITGPLRGDFVKHFLPRYVTCCVQTERNGIGLYVSGDTNGTILVWSETQKEVVAGVKHAHECSITCIIVTKSHIFTGGASDKTINAFAWGRDDMEKVGSVTLPSNVGQVAAICQAGCHLFVGTNQNLIVAVEINHSAYSFSRTEQKKRAPRGMKKKSIGRDEDQDTITNIFVNWDPVDVARGSKNAFKCVCTTKPMKKKHTVASTPRTPTPSSEVQLEVGIQRSSKSAGTRRTPDSFEKRPIKSARTYNNGVNAKRNVADNARSQTPDGPPKLSIAFSSPKLRTHERILQREKSKKGGVPDAKLLFSLENHIDKRMFSSTSFPKGTESKSKDREELNREEPKFFLAASNDGWITAFDANEHCTIGRFKLSVTRDIICMDCCPKRSMITLGCSSGHVILVQVDVNGFETISESYFRAKRSPQRPIKAIKFSKSGKKIAFSVSNEIVIVWAKSSGLPEIERCIGHGSDDITSLDWSSVRLRSAELLRSCSLQPEPEIIVWSIDPVKNIEDLSIVRNIKWESDSCPVDFAVKGLWDHFSNPKELSCLLISSDNMAEVRSKQEDSDGFESKGSFRSWKINNEKDHQFPQLDSVCCVGDVTGSVRSYIYPSICSDTTESVSRVFHSPVNFISSLSTHLLAAGTEDNSIVQFDISQKEDR